MLRALGFTAWILCLVALTSLTSHAAAGPEPTLVMALVIVGSLTILSWIIGSVAVLTTERRQVRFQSVLIFVSVLIGLLVLGDVTSLRQATEQRTGLFNDLTSEIAPQDPGGVAKPLELESGTSVELGVGASALNDIPQENSHKSNLQSSEISDSDANSVEGSQAIPEATFSAFAERNANLMQGVSRDQIQALINLIDHERDSSGLMRLNSEEILEEVRGRLEMAQQSVALPAGPAATKHRPECERKYDDARNALSDDIPVGQYVELLTKLEDERRRCINE